MTQAYPLQWPEGWPRTRSPSRARFSTGFAAARDALLDEIRLIGGKQPVLSTNIELRRDGLPYANRAEPDDPGAAVYWTAKDGEQRGIACDRWDRVKDNIQALRLTIAALRGLDRWGSSEIVSRAFTGFQRLEAPSGDWSEVLGVSPTAGFDEIRRAYQRLRKMHHPDHGGDVDQFQRIQRAYEAGIGRRSR